MLWLSEANQKNTEMPKFKITAQSFTSLQRIAKVVFAADEATALRSVARVLDDAGFYPIDAKRV